MRNKRNQKAVKDLFKVLKEKHLNQEFYNPKQKKALRKIQGT